MRFQDDLIITNGVLNADIASAAQDINQMLAYAVHGVYTGAGADGTLETQASNDGTNWILIAGTQAVVAGPGQYMVNVENAGYKFARVVFTFSSGTGLLNVRITAKG